MLVEADPVFCQSLAILLRQYPDLAIVVYCNHDNDALQWLAQQSQPQSEQAPLSATSTDQPSSQQLDLVLIDLGISSPSPQQKSGLDICQDISSHYPNLPILLLGVTSEPVVVAAAQAVGATGYCLKYSDNPILLNAIRMVGQGQPYWSKFSAPDITPSTDSTSIKTRIPSVTSRLLKRWQTQLRQSGVQQIESAIAILDQQLQQSELPPLDTIVLSGRRRELRAARWIVQHLFLLPADEPEPASQSQSSANPMSSPDQTTTPTSPAFVTQITPDSNAQLANSRILQGILMDAMVSKLQYPLQNQTGAPLEIDILRDDRKRELLYLTLRHIEASWDELRHSQLDPNQINEKRSAILLSLWEDITTEFFGRYFQVRFQEQDLELVTVLLGDRAIVQQEILDKIPLTQPLFNHLLFQNPLCIDGEKYAAGNPEALQRSEIILENILISVANAVMQPLLNHFANAESIKQQFYDQRLMSSREIERFRNNLSWKYRLQNYVLEPKAIFESQYYLLTLSGRGIQQSPIYAAREQELAKLSGLRFTVTLALETRDAIAPRLRSAISFLGSGIIYILTDVIGRGIGLIGRGIIKGIGTAWQDNRMSRQAPPQRQDPNS